MQNILSPFRFLQASGKTQNSTKKGPGRKHKQGTGNYGNFTGGFTGAKLFKAMFNQSLTKKHN